MIGVWMLYCALWALWSSAAAWVVERILLRGRAPVRAVWLGAMTLSIVGPVLGYSLPRRAPMAVQSSASSVETMRVTASPGAYVSRRIARPTRVAVLRDVVAQADRPLAVAWVLLSIAVVVYVAGGLLHLRYLLRGWRPGVVNGVDVMISDDTGPALVGVLRSTIVVPKWALALEPSALSLLMRHELEHRAAGDARLLALAQFLVAAIPWNPISWWQLRRLRLAVELDCDARVLHAAPDVLSYGRLLLEFGRPRRDFRFAGAALADHAEQLEQRIRVMTSRGRIAKRRSMVTLSAMAGVLAIAIGCQMPAPTHPVSPTPPEPRDSARYDAKATNTHAALDSAKLALPARDSLDGRKRAEFRTQMDALKRALDSADRAAKARGEPQPYFEFRVEKIVPGAAALRAAAGGLDSAAKRLDSAAQAPSEPLAKTYFDAAMRGDSATLAAAARQLAALARLSTPSDSLDVLRSEPGCSAGAGSTESVTVRLLVSDLEALRGGRIDVNAVATRGSGAQIGFGTDGMTCSTSGRGLLRLYGAGAFDGRPINVNSSAPTSIVVVSGSGRVLAGPVAFDRESRRIELSWPPSR